MATKKMVRIINTTAGRCSFKPYGAASFIRIEPTRDGDGYPIEVEVLRNTLSQDRGVQAMFKMGMFILDDQKVADEIGLVSKHPLIRTHDEIKTLIEGADNELEDYLNDIVDENNVKHVTAMPDLVCAVAREMGLSDLNKLRLIKEYTGYEIEDVMTELTKVDEPKVKDAKTKKKSNKKKSAFEE